MSELALVTGGGGFLGRAIVEQLLARGDRVRVLGRSPQPDLAAREGVEMMQGDLRDAETVARACAGTDLVIHTAAKAGYWGRRADYEAINVAGSDHVLAGCRAAGVGRLVYTSSPSVVIGPDSQLAGADESTPYPARYLAHYPRTKAEAERRVLAASGDGLLTCSLRPHIIWGPGDNHLVPRLLARARAGKLFLVGDGRNKTDAVYVDNAAEAHLLAADRLRSGEGDVAGRAFFINQDEPVVMWDFIGRILGLAGVDPPSRRVSFGLAYRMGWLLEGLHQLLPGEPRMTRFLAVQLAHDHWFDGGAARRELGYRPRVSLEEGLERLGASLASNSSTGR